MCYPQFILALNFNPQESFMYRDNYKTSLESELVDIVKTKLSPIALKYGYSETDLDSEISWAPVVLILGNYSSGKSTLINEYLGGRIQATGQAPTDDSFTVIVGDDSYDEPVGIVEEHDGRYLLNDQEYPFEKLKKYGQRFASHICIKKVNSPFLKDLVLIDTPGMLDSVSEKDRGYNYQEVIGDLARISDLILVLFDPHKAGTVQETYVALRETLPANTFEERVLFVLNRIDECASMTDLLQVYGTLCWNLSQMTGRKDIPTIHLTYSKGLSEPNENSEYLVHLDNQRERLKNSILKAPDFRLEHLATFVESHSENLNHLIEALISFRKKQRLFNLKFFSIIAVSFILTCGLAIFITNSAGISVLSLPLELQGIVTGSFLLFYLLCTAGIRRYFKLKFLKEQISKLDDLTLLDNQRRKDSWHAVKCIVKNFLEQTSKTISIRNLKKDYERVMEVAIHGVREIREALKELTTIPEDSDVECEEEELSEDQNNG